jgi:copper resistance protein C
MRPRLFAAAVCAACLIASTAARAHAFLDHAVPAVGSTVAKSPTKVTLWFTQDLEPAFSSATVTDNAGERADNGRITIDPHDKQEMHVGLKPLAPGEYTVRWHVVSVDTHRTEGDFSFTVGR